MSDLWINIRFGTRYLQITPHRQKKVAFKKGLLPRSEFKKSWEIYRFFWYHKPL